MATEQRTIKAHPKLIFDVITRQSGSIGKAIIEGIMNSADARATFCNVTIDAHKLTIVDNGSGIASKDDIEKFFETLGTPHDESEKKIYGTFRMGRGQIFSFGKNIWRTSEFLMNVDIKNKGLDYELNTKLEPVDGCKIEVELYDPLLPSGVYDVVRDVKKMAKYVPLQLKVNGEVASVDPETEKWDHITDEAYIRLTSSTNLAIYNLGIWVRDFGNYQFGCGGVVVSKKQLTLNFARNDIMNANCNVWKKVKKFVDQKATDKNKNKPILDEGERQRLAEQIMSGCIEGKQAAVLKVFTDVSGKHLSAEQISRCSVASKVTHAPKGDLRGDKLMQSRSVFVFADDTLERFGVNLQGIIHVIQKKCFIQYYEPLIVNYQDVTCGMNEEHYILDHKQLTAREKLILDLFNFASYDLVTGLVYSNSYGVKRDKIRQTLVGISASVLAWTNGCSYICFDREFLKSIQLDIDGMISLFTVGLHEYCHDDSDSGTHVHALEFYQQFHDANIGIRRAVSRVMGNLPMLIERNGQRLTKAMLKQHDREIKTAAAMVKHPKLVEGVVKADSVAATVAPIMTTIRLSNIDDMQCPYRMASNYGVLFILGNSQSWTKEGLLKAAAQSTGKAEKLVANDLTVLMNPKHKSNGNRSQTEHFNDGTFKIVKV